MGFAFVHTGDWHIGRKFRSFEPGLASALEEARLEAIDTLARVAAGAGVRHVLVAGDAFDAEDVPAKTIRQAIERMRRHGALTWCLLPGNHDPARPKGLWSRFGSLAAPNVLSLVDATPHELEPGVVLLPAPLTARVAPSDPTAWFDGAVTPTGTIRIGLAHGSIKGFGSDAASSIPIDPQRAAKAALDYLALGDWHGTMKVEPRTWYSGTPEPDSFADNDPGNVLVVRIAGAGAEPAVERVRTGRYAWRQLSAGITSELDLAALDRRLEAAAVPFERLIVKLALSGRITTELDAEILSWRDCLEARLRHLELDLDGITVRPSATGHPGGVDADPVLGPLADKLRAIEMSGEEDRARAAAAALRKLVELDRRHREAAE